LHTSCLMNRPLPTSTPLPYTTLFRSARPIRRLRDDRSRGSESRAPIHRDRAQFGIHPDRTQPPESSYAASGWRRSMTIEDAYERSEEHTSELQSRENLVCRLLLEKKK